MKTYTITVNGTVYSVTVEEGAAADVIIVNYNPLTPMNENNINGHLVFGVTGHDVVTTVANGKVFKVEASVGQAVKAGDPVIILEAMKMEIPVVAPQDGTVASIDVAVGDAVEAGATLASLN